MLISLRGQTESDGARLNYVFTGKRLQQSSIIHIFTVLASVVIGFALLISSPYLEVFLHAHKRKLTALSAFSFPDTVKSVHSALVELYNARCDNFNSASDICVDGHRVNYTARIICTDSHYIPDLTREFCFIT